MLLPDVQVVNFGYPNPVVDHGIRFSNLAFQPSNQIQILDTGHQQKSIAPDYAMDRDMADEQRKSLCQLQKNKKKNCYEQSKEESTTYKPSNQIKILEKGHQQKSIVPDYATDSDMADEQRKSLCQLKKKKKKKCYEQSKEESPTS